MLRRSVALARKADAVVRVTGDCPIIEPSILDRVIHYYKINSGKTDYVSNVLKRTYPRGLDCEVFSMKALEKAHSEAKAPSDREHVTKFIYEHPTVFRLTNVAHLKDEARHRWTVDTADDFLLIEKIFNALYASSPKFGMEEVLALLQKNPEWMKINENIKQKSVTGETR